MGPRQRITDFEVFPQFRQCQRVRVEQGTRFRAKIDVNMAIGWIEGGLICMHGYKFAWGIKLVSKSVALIIALLRQPTCEVGYRWPSVIGHSVEIKPRD